MTVYVVIGINKDKSHVISELCDSLEAAEVSGELSAHPDFTICSEAKLGDTFTTPQLAEMFNALPGEEKVTRFADKTSAVTRLMRKATAAKEAGTLTGAPAKKPRKAKAKREPGTPREPRKLNGSVKLTKAPADLRWKPGGVRQMVYGVLAANGNGAIPLEEFVASAAEQLKLPRAKVVGAVRKLEAMKRVVIA